MDTALELIMANAPFTFSLWSRVYSDIFEVSNKNPELVQTIYKNWSQKISPNLEKPILEETLRKFNNIFSYAIRKGIIEKAGDEIKERHLHTQISIRHLLLTTINVFPYDMTKLIVQTMLEIGF